jgi:hypothetical protein
VGTSGRGGGSSSSSSSSSSNKNSTHEEFRFGSYRYKVPKSCLNGMFDRQYEFLRRNGLITDEDFEIATGGTITSPKELDAASKRQLVVNKINEIENNPALFKRYGGDVARELNWGALTNDNIIPVGSDGYDPDRDKKKTKGGL